MYIIYPAVGVLAFLAVIANFLVPLGSRKQLRAILSQAQDMVKQNQEMVREDQFYRKFPIISPIGEISLLKSPGSRLYASDDNLQWSVEDPIMIKMRNVEDGLAFNVNCILYGPERLPFHQFVSWDNISIEGRSSNKDIIFEHSQQMHLSRNDSIDGIHPLYDESEDSRSNPIADRIARLTITYHDIFGEKYVTIHNYTRKRKWVTVTARKISSIDGKPPIDLKELNNQRKQ